MPFMPGASAFSSFGTSTTKAPMVIAVPAIETEFRIASLVTRAGSTTPAVLRSISLLRCYNIYAKTGFGRFDLRQPFIGIDSSVAKQDSKWLF
jgi:hypothetical protein